MDRRKAPHWVEMVGQTAVQKDILTAVLKDDNLVLRMAVLTVLHWALEMAHYWVLLMAYL